MGLFRRRGPSGPQDSALPFMAEADAATLRGLVRTVFAESGREVTVYADHVVDDAGSQFGLWNLAALCADSPRKEWRSLVERHVEGITAPAVDLATLSDEEFRGGLYLRLVEAASLPQPDRYPHARALADDLVVMLSIDLPTTVTVVPDQELTTRGAIEELVAHGTANLRGLLNSDELEAQRLSLDDGGWFTAVMGDSFFTASCGLLLDDLTSKYGEARDDGRGVLVVVPNRHIVCFRIIDGPDAVLALNHLFGFALKSYAESAGPLSPHVFWVRESHWTQVTRFDEEGRPCVDVSAELAQALSLDD